MILELSKNAAQEKNIRWRSQCLRWKWSRGDLKLPMITNISYRLSTWSQAFHRQEAHFRDDKDAHCSTQRTGGVPSGCPRRELVLHYCCCWGCEKVKKLIIGALMPPGRQTNAHHSASQHAHVLFYQSRDYCSTGCADMDPRDSVHHPKYIKKVSV